MSEHAREWLFWGLMTVLVALVVHFASVYALPRLIMARALERLGPPNAMHVGKRPDASARAIVRPSPDLLYASCPYDLSKGPLRLVAPVAHGNYWSVSAFDDNTNNFFVKNDLDIVGPSIEVLVLMRGQPWPRLDNALQRIILFSPSQTGLLLIRTVIDDEKHVPALKALLAEAGCETVAPAKR